MVTSSADFVQENCLAAGRLQNGVIWAADGPVHEEPRYGNGRKERAASLPLRSAVTGKHALIVPERTDNLALTRRFVAQLGWMHRRGAYGALDCAEADSAIIEIRGTYWAVLQASASQPERIGETRADEQAG